MKCWCLCCQPQGGVTPSPQRAPALFEPDVGRQASPAAPLPSPLLFSLLHSFSFAAAWPSAATLVGALMLLWMDHCCISLSARLLPPIPISPAVLLSSCSFPVGSLYPSIHLSPPFPLFSPHPSCLAHCPFPLRSGERVLCVCVIPLPPPFLLPHPSPFSLFPPLSFLSLHPRPTLASVSPLCHLSLHHSPPTSFCLPHSLHLLIITRPSISFTPGPPFILTVTLSPSLSPPSSSSSCPSLPHVFLGWAQEQ